MEKNLFCQSCNMPLDRPELFGTEKDGSKSSEYCVYCYQSGSFTNPDLSLEEMKILVKEQMENEEIDAATIDFTIKGLDNLQRWRNNGAAL